MRPPDPCYLTDGCGAFLEAISAAGKEKAIRSMQKMGYEFHISHWRREGGSIEIDIENRGVAHFYHDWPVELAAGDAVVVKFDLRGILLRKGEDQFRYISESQKISFLERACRLKVANASLRTSL
jgi:hypothetical protein